VYFFGYGDEDKEDKEDVNKNKNEKDDKKNGYYEN
jgi:hypothetical protein